MAAFEEEKHKKNNKVFLEGIMKALNNMHPHSQSKKGLAPGTFGKRPTFPIPDSGKGGKVRGKGHIPRLFSLFHLFITWPNLYGTLLLMKRCFMYT